MSTAAPTAPTPATAAPILVSAFTPAQTKHWELGVSLILHAWTPLTDAVSASWGGEASADKRDWLCGAIADLFVERPDTDEFDVEDTLVGVMEDEFEVAVEDGSGYDVGKKVLALRDDIAAGRFEGVQDMHRAFLAKPQNRGAAAAPRVEEVDQEAGSSEDEEEGDVEMGGVAAPVAERAPVERVVDEDGFELVQKRKGRRG
ncbi:Pre-rRNA-processing protein TSR2-domain-containing protein [Geopyxis carbonaria]|nr:Pre-rRNA-processing protein TSR2-domain-containing protein [Geopyxis carbonaria]